MIENQALNYRQDRMSYAMYQEVQLTYRQRPVKQVDRPCITPVGMKDGGRFDAKA